MVGITRKAMVIFKNSDEREVFDKRIKSASSEFSDKLMNEKIKQSGIKIIRKDHFNAKRM